jgi:ketosteroid isomerase-like protein
VEYRELDDGSILVPFESSGRAKASGLDTAQISTRGAALFHVRHGSVTKLVLYWDRSALESAFPDLGLEE